MKYNALTENHTPQILMEVLEEESQKNPVWTLQGLLALCRDVSLLDDVPEHADYFDEIYLTFAELFSEFNHYGRFLDMPDTLNKVSLLRMRRQRMSFSLPWTRSAPEP